MALAFHYISHLKYATYKQVMLWKQSDYQEILSIKAPG